MARQGEANVSLSLPAVVLSFPAVVLSFPAVVLSILPVILSGAKDRPPLAVLSRDCKAPHPGRSFAPLRMTGRMLRTTAGKLRTTAREPRVMSGDAASDGLVDAR